jgi:hypothetical protein
MTRSYLKTTRWSGALLAAVLLSSFAFGSCWYVVVCPDCCCPCAGDEDAGNAGAPTGEVGSCGSELGSRSAARSPSTPDAAGALLAESRRELSPELSRPGAATTLGDPVSAKPDVLYLLHASFLI